MDRTKPRGPLRPLELEGLAGLTRVEAEWPVYVATDLTWQPFAAALGSRTDSPDTVIHAFDEATAHADLANIADVRERTLDTLEDRFGSGMGSVRKTLPKDGWLVPFTRNALPLLYGATVATARRAAKELFLSKLTRQCERLRELLRLDDAHTAAGSSAEILSASMGSEASYFDASVLASAFHRKTDATRQMEPKRRERVEGILATLEHAIKETRHEPTFFLFHSATAPASATAFGGQLRQCGDSFEAALEFCDERLERFARYLRALRAAKLEMEGAFEPAVHEEWLARFDWQTADPEELAASPAFVVLEPAEWLARTSFASFGRLLRSGRPVQVLIPHHGLEGRDSDGDLRGFMPDFGYLSIAHREAFVLQSSLAHPEHLKAGLAAVSQSLRPAVAVICVPPARETEASEAQAWLETSLLHLTRAFPLYRYDPDRGESWMERFELQEVSSSETLTAAHAVAVSNEFRGQFRLLPDSDGDEEQMELAEYLERYRQAPPLAIPYLRVIDENGQARRAVVTRELVNLSRDRRKAYRVFEELAGVKNAHVEAAVVKARADAQEKARAEGATAAIHRVIGMLADGQSLAGAATVALTAPSAGSPVASPSVASAVPVQSAEAEAAPEDPYIDTFLCTSCNDCMKVNPLVFAYDANKQAYIGNAKAGTFAELVKAAEGCPAKCIHPGTPRADDTSATSAVRARATKFK